MTAEFFRGFQRLSLRAGNGIVCLRRGGSGSAVLLLHGFPETHLAWRHVAPRLAEHFTVIAADLPGYGDSLGPEPAGHVDRFSKRAMAQQLVQSLTELRIARFAVVGHDRGARVAYRMALDHPERVSALTILDVVPTIEVVERLTYAAARQMVNWWLLAQPSPLPEEIIGANPDPYLRYILASWGGLDVIEPAVFEEYGRCFRNPRVLRAICAEYRAGDSIDLDHDRSDRQEGRRIRCPVQVIWAAGGLVPLFGDPVSIWRGWADRVEGEAISTRGHFMMEELPEQTHRRIHRFLATKK